MLARSFELSQHRAAVDAVAGAQIGGGERPVGRPVAPREAHDDVRGEPGDGGDALRGVLLDVLGEEGIGAIVFSPLAQGLLTDRYLGGIPEDSRVRRGNYFSEQLLSDWLLPIADCRLLQLSPEG